MDYAEFLDRKTQGGADSGFAPLWMPPFLFDFQSELVEWAIRKGRAAIFADCGLGKTPTEPATGRPSSRYAISPKITKGAGRPTAKTDESLVSAVMAVPHPGVSEDLKGAAHG